MRHNPAEGYAHKPILFEEILMYIRTSPLEEKGTFADFTLGEGGHSELILETFPGVNLVGFERDPEIVEVARERLSRFGNRVKIINDNFSNADKYLDDESISYMLYDFGISSYHFDRSGRGFAFSDDQRLDMRLDKKGESAFDIVNGFKESELADIFFRYGEERFSKRIAGAICMAREEKPIETTTELASIVLGAIPKKFHVKNIHPATRVFQALRIVVNDELVAIEKALSFFQRLLVKGGRMMAISFHSLEDRLVKQRLKELAAGCTCGMRSDRCECHKKAAVNILTKKPVEAGEEEVRNNKRSRSAKLRVCEKN